MESGLITADMGHFHDVSSRLGNTKKPSDALVSQQLHAMKRLPYMAIGHEDIATKLTKIVYKHPIKASGRPLVLMFAGPSGHGKTEMGKSIARLFEKQPFDAANHMVIPCGSISTETELFGLGGAYQSSEQHSQLSKFVMEHQGHTAVVILDEFEKLEQRAQEAFLEPFDTGEMLCLKLLSVLIEHSMGLVVTFCIEQ